MEDGEIDEEGVMVVEEEEQEQEQDAQHRKIEKSPYELLQESKSSVEDIVTKMLSIKNESKSKTNLRDLVTQMFLHFVTLRQVLPTSLSLSLGFIILFKLFTLFFCVIGESFDIARGRSCEGRNGACKGTGGLHVASASQFDVRKKSLCESNKGLQ